MLTDGIHNLILVLKNKPEILRDFNILTALPFQDIDIKHIQTDKCQEVIKQLEKFYCEQPEAATSSTAAALVAMQTGKTSLPLDYFVVKICIFWSELLYFAHFLTLIVHNRFYMTKHLHIRYIV